MKVTINKERGEDILFISKEEKTIFIENSKGILYSFPQTEISKIVDALNKLK